MLPYNCIHADSFDSLQRKIIAGDTGNPEKIGLVKLSINFALKSNKGAFAVTHAYINL